MYPELFKIGPLTVYSYGLMLGIAFIVASYLLTKEFERRKMNPNLATEITLIAIIFGIIGAKLFHLFENWEAFLNNPLKMAFSPGGLTFHGGLLLVILAVWIYSKRKKIPFLTFADLAAPSLALAYGIGRIGCHLAGDGDYGIPTDLPWGTNYENGTVPPSAMFRGSEIAKTFPGGIVPDNTPLHPTPIYEFLTMVVIFFILWKFRKKEWPDGKLFTIYLMLAGLERLLVEFIRLNPRILFGLSEAQLVSIGLFAAGLIGYFYFENHKELKRFNPPPFIPLETKKK
ncbi:MAG: prolipoprotein diacylglyceryl transferase [Ignavibacteriaceae bacterium]|nr:prolipoprotein diacylglyceryl transferase [Ignavibacteriaceae bacterium]